eukprot:c24446_g1_i7 orf=111-521(+)
MTPSNQWALSVWQASIALCTFFSKAFSSLHRTTFSAEPNSKDPLLPPTASMESSGDGDNCVPDTIDKLEIHRYDALEEDSWPRLLLSKLLWLLWKLPCMYSADLGRLGPGFGVGAGFGFGFGFGLIGGYSPLPSRN